jgi:hypothetical protein
MPPPHQPGEPEVDGGRASGTLRDAINHDGESGLTLRGSASPKLFAKMSVGALPTFYGGPTDQLSDFAIEGCCLLTGAGNASLG